MIAAGAPRPHEFDEAGGPHPAHQVHPAHQAHQAQLEHPMHAPHVVPASSATTYRIHRYPSALIDRLDLADGRRVIVRPVLPQDADDEQRFVQALSPKSRRARFHGAVNRLPAPVLAGMTAIDYDRHVALVAEAVLDDGATHLVADARYVIEEAHALPRPARGPEAEFAIAVADDWQGRGLGRALLERLARHAWARGLGTLHGVVLADNEPMLAMLRRMGFGFRSDPHESGLVHARLHRGG